MRNKIPFIILAVIATAIALATFIEGYHSADVAKEWVYSSVWFVALWGLMVALSVPLIAKFRLWRQLSVFLLHAAFVTILAGALTTWCFGERGEVHFREADFYKVDESTVLRFNEFTVLCDSVTMLPQDYRSYCTVERNYSDSIRKTVEQVVVSMNKPVNVNGTLFTQAGYDFDLRGTTLMVNHDPYGIAITYTGYVMLLVATLMILVKKRVLRIDWSEHRGQTITILAIVTVMAVLALSYAIYLRTRTGEDMPPILRSPWLISHVSTIVFGYALYLFMAVNSAIYLIRGKEWTTRLNRTLLFPATFLLAIGIFIGAVWANESWGTYWSWDPKESWALISMLTYGVAFHRRSLPWLRNDRNFHIYILLAFLTIIMTYFGVNYALGGMHSYA